MKIKCWGSRGSIPVSGKDYVKYGGDTTCIEIRTKNDDIIIVDAGTGIRRLGKHLIKEGRLEFSFIFTHAHWDHIMGFPFFEPIYVKGTKIRVFRCPFPTEYVKEMLNNIMAPPYFPVRFSDLGASFHYEAGCPKQFKIGSVSVTPIALSHPNGGSGYKFMEDGKQFVFITDNELGFRHPGGLAFSDYVTFCTDVDLLIHDAEYTLDEYNKTVSLGHSTYTDTLNLALKAGVKKLGFFHLNRERTDKGMDEIVETCRINIAEKRQYLECFAVGHDMTFDL